MLFLAALSFSLNTSYSLSPPLEFTNLSEIGNWTLRGSSSNMKKFIRLTSNAADQYGSACLRIPTFFRNWAVQFELSIQAGNTPGDGIYIQFTKDVCPDRSQRFDGFLLWINTQATNRDGFSPVYFSNGTQPHDERRQLGKIQIRSKQKRSTVLSLSRHQDRLALEISTGSGSSDRVFALAGQNLLPYGYFTVSAASRADADIHDLISVLMYPSADERDAGRGPSPDVGYSAVNRKVIENAKLKRRPKKEERRKSMPVAWRLLEDAKGEELTDRRGDLSQAIDVIKETQGRARQDITVRQLDELIMNRIRKTVLVAYKKLELATEKFQETGLELNELWSGLKAELLGLSVEAMGEMHKLEKEMIDYLNHTNLGVGDAERLKEEAQAVPDSAATMLLAAIAIIELVCYLCFFFMKRSATKGFRKID
jgi:hypothetical protein